MTFLGVGEWLARRAELTPTKIGLIDGETGECYTYITNIYAKLNVDSRASAVAAALERGLLGNQG